MTGEQAETRERRRANVKTLRGIFLSLETHSQIRGDPAYRQENDLMLKLIQLPTPKKSFSKADLALIMLQIQKMHIGTISLAEAWPVGNSQSLTLTYWYIWKQFRDHRLMHLWQPVKWFKRYVTSQPGLLWCGSKRCWWLRSRWFPLNWALMQHFNNIMKSCISAELETPQIAKSSLIWYFIKQSVNSRCWFGKWSHSILTWSLKVKVNIWSYFTSYAKLLGTCAVAAKLYRFLIFLSGHSGSKPPGSVTVT